MHKMIDGKKKGIVYPQGAKIMTDKKLFIH